MLTPVRNERYIGIKSDGRFHEKVDKDRDGAVLREYELKDGSKGSKWELLYQDICDVFIKSIRFEDSEFGENINVILTDGDNEVVWSENTGTNFASDFMKRLPNINLEEKMSIKPYAFTGDDGKMKRGVNVYQQNVKIQDFFYDHGNKKKTNGFPEIGKPISEMGKNDWKKYFLDVQIFLTDYVKANIVPKFKIEIKETHYPTAESEGIDPNDVPF